MPIRFRCAYCNQLMGIARRKAGTVVRCPTCSGQVVVPSLEEAGLGAEDHKGRRQASTNPANVFESDDMDKMLEGAAGDQPSIIPGLPGTGLPSIPAPGSPPVVPVPVPSPAGMAPMPVPMPGTKPGIWI